MEIVLNWHEMAAAAAIGVKRQIGALIKGKMNSHGLGDEKDEWGIHIEGAAGEMAAAKAIDRYYSGPIDTYRKGGDVGRFQVKTRSDPDYGLLVRERDRDEEVFILVVGKAPKFRVVGWMFAGEAKREEWLKDYGGREPAYFVPQKFLRPLDTLEDHSETYFSQS